MNVVAVLLEDAIENKKLLNLNQERGDRPEIPRDLDFVLYAKDEVRAKLVANFINDNHYGKPSIQHIDSRREFGWRLTVVIYSPTTENVVQTLSGFMVCLSKLYDLDYDGWGCVLMKEA